MDRQEELAAKLETYLAHEVLAPAPVSDPFDEAADRASRTLAEIGTFAAKTLSGRSVPRLALVDLVGRGHVRIRSLPWPLNGLLVDERGSLFEGGGNLIGSCSPPRTESPLFSDMARRRSYCHGKTRLRSIRSD